MGISTYLSGGTSGRIEKVNIYLMRGKKKKMEVNVLFSREKEQ